MWVPLQSPIKVYCEVTVKLSNGTAFIGDSSITVRDRLNGKACCMSVTIDYTLLSTVMLYV